MGDYTTNQKYYKPDGDEFVNVEQDLNYNLRRADQRIKPLVEYAITDVPSITSASIPKDTGFKWWKSYTNSVWAQRSDGIIYQDPNAQIDIWSNVGFTWEPGYGPANNDIDNVAATFYNNFARLRGRVVLNGGSSDIPANVVTNFMTLPAHLRPATQKYFTIYGGNATSGDFQIFRLFIPQSGAADPRCEFVKYGGASSGIERYISLNDVYYALD